MQEKQTLFGGIAAAMKRLFGKKPATRPVDIGALLSTVEQLAARADNAGEMHAIDRLAEKLSRTPDAPSPSTDEKLEDAVVALSAATQRHDAEAAYAHIGDAEYLVERRDELLGTAERAAQ